MAHRARSSFLSAISHEIRTPMTGIIGSVDLAVEQVKDETAKASLSIALKCAQRLQFLLEDVLDYSALEAGNECSAFEPVELSKLVDDVVESIDHAGEVTGQVRFLPEADVPETIKADMTKLRRVLRHLIGNGFKFGSRPQVTLSVERRYWTGRDEYLFSVRSPGAEIPRELRASIFEAFTQADMSSTRERDGAGIGLALSRATTESMGGELGYNRIGDSLNEFWFSIPTKII
nr:histidine kinase dimerization/phospho-acceptor domain-containing protein [Parvularcula mediterranea]